MFRVPGIVFQASYSVVSIRYSYLFISFYILDYLTFLLDQIPVAVDRTAWDKFTEETCKEQQGPYDHTCQADKEVRAAGNKRSQSIIFNCNQFWNSQNGGHCKSKQKSDRPQHAK